MNQVILAVKKIQTISDALVDCNYLQGGDKLIAALRKRTGDDVPFPLEEILNDYREDITAIKEWVKPYHLPDDYLFFLEYYGGLAIKKANYRIATLGAGVMVEEWYGYVMGDDAIIIEPTEDKMLYIGSLSLWKGRIIGYVSFFLDLAGIVQRFCVLGMHSWGPEGSDLSPFIHQPDAYPHRVRKLGNSFTEWLEGLAESEGTFGYVDDYIQYMSRQSS